jgi:hypothetical protein
LIAAGIIYKNKIFDQNVEPIEIENAFEIGTDITIE